MLIANPIYDNVFKYLMEDREIAEGVLSTIRCILSVPKSQRVLLACNLNSCKNILFVIR